MDTFITVLVTAALCLTLCLIVLFVRKRREEKKIRELIDYLTRVQDHSELPQMKEMTEGQLGILQSEIYKVVTILKEEYSYEHRQKKYMSDMMSDISHQFKTPLTAVSLMTELLMAPDITEEQRYDYAAKIDTQISKMTWLIRNLLTLSQLEAGVLEMRCEDILLSSVTEDIGRSLEVMADAGEVKLSFHIPEGLTVHADGHWLREALTNIVKNCIEHTPEGGFVRIEARRDNLAAHIQIEDNGRGIEKKHLPHIFERFYKAGNASNESVGIGLAMAKQIIRNHGGDINAESEVGVGTKFLIRLP